MNTKVLSRGIGKCLAALAFILCAFTSAQAQDLGALELDRVYPIQGNFQDVTATFTAPRSGDVLCIGNVSWYSDAACSEASMITGTYKGYIGNTISNSYKVTAGTTYYLKESMVMNPYDLKLTMGDDKTFELVSASPAAGEYLSATGRGSIVIRFNVPVTASEVTLNANGVSKNVYGVSDGNSFQVDIKNALTDWYNKGVIAQNDVITLRIGKLATNVGGNLYNGTGVFEISFKAAQKPVNLVSANIPANFKSYYAPGDPEGVISLTFDAPVVVSTPATLVYGSAESKGSTATLYVEEVTPTVNGNTLSYDFTGKIRTPENMLNETTVYPTIDFNINNLKDEQGNYVASSGAGTLGSFAYRMNYNLIPKASVMAQFSPANGKSLQGFENLSVWLNCLDLMTFDGFTFTYSDNGTDNSVTVPLSAVTRDPASGSEATFTMAIPAEVKGKQNVRVTLANLVVKDGYDHSRDIKGVFDAFVITESNPANGTALASLNRGDKIILAVNIADRYPNLYMEYQVRDLNPTIADQAVVKSYTWLNRQADGSFMSEVMSNVKLVRGHEYHIEVTAWEDEQARWYDAPALGQDFISITGTSEPFKASDINFVSVDPAAESTLPADFTTFTLTFDGMVNINPEDAKILEGMGTSSNFKSVVPFGDSNVDPATNKTYCDVWQLILPENYVKDRQGGIIFTVKAYDEKGLLVNGNYGYEESQNLQFSYDTPGNFADFETSPYDMEEVLCLTEITVSCERGILPSYNPEVDPIKIYCDRELVATVTDMVKGDETADVNPSLTLVLDNELYNPGNYQIIFPEGIFNIGSEFDQAISMKKVVEFYIKAPAKDLEYHTDPAEGTVEKLDKVTLWFDNFNADPDWSCEEKITITPEGGEPVEINDVEFTSPDPDDWFALFDRMIITLPSEITEAGVYTINIPAGYMIIADDQSSSQAITLTYNVVPNNTTGVTDINAANSKVEYFTLQGVKVEKPAKGQILIKRQGGKTSKIKF